MKMPDGHHKECWVPTKIPGGHQNTRCPEKKSQVPTKIASGHQNDTRTRKKHCVPNNTNAMCLPTEKLGANQRTMCLITVNVTNVTCRGCYHFRWSETSLGSL